jgi:hypothetical protein
LVEQLIRNQQVVSSSLTAGSRIPSKTRKPLTPQPDDVIGVTPGSHNHNHNHAKPPDS